MGLLVFFLPGFEAVLGCINFATPTIYLQSFALPNANSFAKIGFPYKRKKNGGRAEKNSVTLKRGQLWGNFNMVARGFSHTEGGAHVSTH